jgi:hypothetical protein
MDGIPNSRMASLEGMFSSGGSSDDTEYIFSRMWDRLSMLRAAFCRPLHIFVLNFSMNLNGQSIHAKKNGEACKGPLHFFVILLFCYFKISPALLILG